MFFIKPLLLDNAFLAPSFFKSFDPPVEISASPSGIPPLSGTVSYSEISSPSFPEGKFKSSALNSKVFLTLPSLASSTLFFESLANKLLLSLNSSSLSSSSSFPAKLFCKYV